MAERGERDLAPLRRWLADSGWPQRVSSFDQYGGPGMTVELVPPPSTAQLAVLLERFGDAYAFAVLGASLHDSSRGSDQA